MSQPLEGIQDRKCRSIRANLINHLPHGNSQLVEAWLEKRKMFDVVLCRRNPIVDPYLHDDEPTSVPREIMIGREKEGSLPPSSSTVERPWYELRCSSGTLVGTRAASVGPRIRLDAATCRM
eukprot:3749695-Rhodomonas_salina.6